MQSRIFYTWIFVLCAAAIAGAVAGGPATAYACANPNPLPGGFAAPCPVLDAQPSQVAPSGSVTVTVSPNAQGQYISQSIYLYNGASWQAYSLSGTFRKGYTTSTATFTISSAILGQLPSGTIYVASWDWTWNQGLGCFVGPSSTACRQGLWRIQSFVLTGGGGGGCTPDSRTPPLQYCARTDLCEFSSSTGCATLGLSFLGRNYTDGAGVYHPLDVAPDMSISGNGLYGTNKCVTDPDFGSKICRVTDYSLASSGLSYNMGSAGAANMWNADGSAFLVKNVGGNSRIFSFSNDANMVSTITDIGGNLQGGDSTHFAGNVTFSSGDPNTLYELDYGRTVNGKPYNQLNQLILNRAGLPSQWTMTRTKIFNFSTDSANCLPSDFYPNWAGSFNISTDDQSFQFAFSDHGQNGVRDANHPYGATLVANYTKGKGCRVLNTYGTNGNGPMTIWGDWGSTGPVTNGAGMALGVSGGAPLYDDMYLHESGPAPDSTYSVISGSNINACTPQTCSCIGITTTGLCESYTWELATTNVRPDFGTGHGAKGNIYEYFGGRYAAFLYHDPWTKLGNLLTQTIPVDQHGSYNNVDAQDNPPVFFASTNVCGQASGAGQAACDPQYTGPLYDEIVATENQASHPSSAHCNYGSGSTACVYRFNHSFNTGTNWAFGTQNAIGNVSPTGRFLLFASDWNLTLGCTNGASTGCLDNIAAETANACATANLKTNPCQRGDVFVVQLQ